MTTKLERQDSVISILSSGIDLCRICHCDSSCGELISPCYCSGSMRWVHQVCLQHWIRASNNKACELCRYPYCMRTKMKPPCYWESLPMSPSEKRRLFCSALFHSIALGCVIWSLYVLIDRTVDELHQSELEWQFWTKIVVEAIGCLGAGILVYVWGKSYFSIVNKWIAFNRTFMIVSSSPPPIKKPLPVVVDTGKPPPSRNPSVTSPSDHSAGGGGGLCRSGSRGGLNTDNNTLASPVVVTMMMPGGGGCNSVGGGHNNADSSCSEKSKLEAKALLLPPVLYSPPQQELPPIHLQNP